MNELLVCAEIFRIILSPIYLSSGKGSSESEMGHVPTFETMVHLTWNDPLISYFLDTQVMLILVLIDVQYSQKAIFSFEKGMIGRNHSFSGSYCPVKNPSNNSDSPHSLLLFIKPCIFTLNSPFWCYLSLSVCMCVCSFTPFFQYSFCFTETLL